MGCKNHCVKSKDTLFRGRLSTPASIKIGTRGSSFQGSAVTNSTSIHKVSGLITALLSGLRIGCFHKPWCRSKTLLGSAIAVAVVWASNCSSDLTLSLGISICHRCDPKKKKKKNWHKRSCSRNKRTHTQLSIQTCGLEQVKLEKHEVM